ncbi:hypothetical protein AMELA_G00278060 [Ameiurus melas]|uniref:Uncharacterized protein n=1 Tax=Ameiurus melas TaxID=219545 RepID=A0A7J5ZJJ9_AMEME|nr:hypothetical protein AMELA_G00278060 [Ameiurus melas]
MTIYILIQMWSFDLIWLMGHQRKPESAILLILSGNQHHLRLSLFKESSPHTQCSVNLAISWCSIFS